MKNNDINLDIVRIFRYRKQGKIQYNSILSDTTRQNALKAMIEILTS